MELYVATLKAGGILNKLTHLHDIGCDDVKGLLSYRNNLQLLHCCTGITIREYTKCVKYIKSNTNMDVSIPCNANNIPPDDHDDAVSDIDDDIDEDIDMKHNDVISNVPEEAVIEQQMGPSPPTTIQPAPLHTLPVEHTLLPPNIEQKDESPTQSNESSDSSSGAAGSRGYGRRRVFAIYDDYVSIFDPLTDELVQLEIIENFDEGAEQLIDYSNDPDKHRFVTRHAPLPPPDDFNYFYYFNADDEDVHYHPMYYKGKKKINGFRRGGRYTVNELGCKGTFVCGNKRCGARDVQDVPVMQVPPSRQSQYERLLSYPPRCFHCKEKMIHEKCNAYIGIGKMEDQISDDVNRMDHFLYRVHQHSPHCLIAPSSFCLPSKQGTSTYVLCI